MEQCDDDDDLSSRSVGMGYVIDRSLLGSWLSEAVILFVLSSALPTSKPTVSLIYAEMKKMRQYLLIDVGVDCTVGTF